MDTGQSIQVQIQEIKNDLLRLLERYDISAGGESGPFLGQLRGSVDERRQEYLGILSDIGFLLRQMPEGESLAIELEVLHRLNVILLGYAMALSHRTIKGMPRPIR